MEALIQLVQTGGTAGLIGVLLFGYIQESRSRKEEAKQYQEERRQYLEDMKEERQQYQEDMKALAREATAVIRQTAESYDKVSNNISINNGLTQTLIGRIEAIVFKRRNVSKK